MINLYLYKSAYPGKFISFLVPKVGYVYASDFSQIRVSKGMITVLLEDIWVKLTIKELTILLLYVLIWLKG